MFKVQIHFMLRVLVTVVCCILSPTLSSGCRSPSDFVNEHVRYVVHDPLLAIFIDIRFEDVLVYQSADKSSQTSPFAVSSCLRTSLKVILLWSLIVRLLRNSLLIASVESRYFSLPLK